MGEVAKDAATLRAAMKGGLAGASSSAAVARPSPGLALRHAPPWHVSRARAGLGTDEGAIINVICRRNAQQIADIRASFKDQFNRQVVPLSR
jgi:hypothetical protein